MGPIQKKSTVDLAVENLKAYIQGDSLHVGDKLPSEALLCKELDISRTTIREAYRVLQSQGYLDIQIGRGAFVQNKKPDFLSEALEWINNNKMKMKDYLYVRLALDPLSSGLAASCATEKDIADLAAIHRAFVESAHGGDFRAMAELDAKFHERIAMISGNDLLIALVRIVNHYFRKLRRASFQVSEHVKHAIAPHEMILEAIANGDTEKARSASIDHMQTAIQDLCQEQPK